MGRLRQAAPLLFPNEECTVVFIVACPVDVLGPAAHQHLERCLQVLPKHLPSRNLLNLNRPLSASGVTEQDGEGSGPCRVLTESARLPGVPAAL